MTQNEHDSIKFDEINQILRKFSQIIKNKHILKTLNFLNFSISRGRFFRVIHTKFYWTAKTKIGFTSWL